MTAGGLVVNAALLATAILLPSLVQLARQGKSIDEYYDEETYYDEKAVDGSADFSEDLTYAQYDLGGMLLPVLWRVLECRWRLQGLHHTARRQRRQSARRPEHFSRRTVTSSSTQKSASPIQSTSTTRPGSRRIHIAKQQDVSAPKTTRRATAESGQSGQLPAPRGNVTGMCRVVRSEAWRQVSLYAECLEISDVRSTDRRLGELRFLRQFRLASQTTDLLWHYLLPHMPEDRMDCQGCNSSQTSRTAEFCTRNLENAKEAVRVLDTEPLPGEPTRGWEIVCRLVKEYKYCVSELLAGCHGITTEMSRKASVKARATTPTYCFASCASCLAAATLWAVVSGTVALWTHAPRLS